MMSNQEESCSSSNCPTEDIDGSETATLFEVPEEISRNAQVIGDGELADCITERDLESLLRDVWEEEIPGSSCGGSQGQERCEDWVNQSSQPTTNCKDGLNESQQFEQTSDEVMEQEQLCHAMKIAALLKDSLKKGKDYAKFGLQSDDQMIVPLSKLQQLYHDVKENLPEALMTMLLQIGKEEDERFIKKILFFACNTDSQPDEADEIEQKPLKRSRQEVTLTDTKKSKRETLCSGPTYFESRVMEDYDGYFDKFEIARNRTVLERSKLNPFIIAAVEGHVNSQIQMSKGKNSPWICISNEVVYKLIIKENAEQGIGLSPDGIAKHVKYVNKHIWENIIGRCLTRLSHRGFVIGVEYPRDIDVFYSTVNVRPAQEEAVVLLDPEAEPLLSLPVNGDGDGRISVAEYAESLHQEFSGTGAGGGSLGSNSSEGEESVENRSFVDELGSQSESEPEVELGRLSSPQDSQELSFTSQGSFNSEFPVPSRSPEDQNRASPERLAQLNDPMSESYLGFLSGSSQGSDASGPILKYRRLH